MGVGNLGVSAAFSVISFGKAGLIVDETYGVPPFVIARSGW